MVSDHSSRDDDDGILFSVSWFHASHRSRQHLAGAWRWIFVIGAVICLYFNLFVAVVQAFEKIPGLHALAPTQTEPPFKLTQLVVLLVSVLLAIVAAIRFRPEPCVATS